MSEFGASGVLFVAEGEIPPTKFKKKKKIPQISLKTIFLKLFLTPVNSVYSSRGPAIAPDEIKETARCGPNDKVAGYSDCK